MQRRKLVLVDPNPGRLAVFERELGKHFELYACASPDLAISMVSTMHAHIIVATMEQALGDGLDLANNAVAACPDHRPVTIVYGQPTEEAVASVRIGKLADIVIGQDLTPQQLLRVMARRLKGAVELERYVPPPIDIDADIKNGIAYYSARPAAPAKTRRPLPALGMVSRARQTLDAHAPAPVDDTRAPLPPSAWTRIQDALTQPVTPLIEDLPADRLPTWTEIAHARAKGRNLRIALRQPVTPLIEEIPSDGPLTLSQVLRARASGRNLGLALSPATWRRVG
ncbi:MAG: hypothetical protein H6742_13365 [Alphaproteobacteria bacterium]|nr:hypothetical protein [Alphaproteobacteria bacterium]